MGCLYLYAQNGDRNMTVDSVTSLPAIHMALYKSVYYYYYFLTPVLNSQGMKKITLCNTKKYKNQAGMNLSPPRSQNSRAVRWHCTGGQLSLASLWCRLIEY